MRILPKHKLIWSLSLLMLCFALKNTAQKPARPDSLLTALQTAKDTARVIALNGLGWEYRYKDINRAFLYCKEALDLSEKLKYKPGLAAAYNNIGAIFEIQNKNEQAIEHFKNSLRIREELKDYRGIARTTVNIGIIYAKEGSLDTAEKYMQKALFYHRNGSDMENTAIALFNLGAVHEMKNNKQLALDYYYKALKIHEDNHNDANIARCLNNIGYVYYTLNDFAKAKNTLLRSNDIAKQVKDRHTLQNNYEILADVYANEKLFKEAYECHVAFTDLNRQLFNEKSMAQLQELQEKYDADKKQKQIELLNKEKEKQSLLTQEETKRKNILIFSVLGVFILTAVFSVFLYNRFRITQKQKDIIEEKNKQITDSINYAKRIQSSLLPTEKYISRILNKKS